MIGLIFRLFDAAGGPGLFGFFWHIVTAVSPLTEAEISAASAVLGPSGIRYNRVRVAERRLLTLIFKINGKRAFTTFHTVNLPSTGSHSRPHLDLLTHELVHVRQFEHVGSVYIWQALRAQRTDGYGYGGPEQLTEDRNNGKHFRDYNREQQGQIAQDYYRNVVERALPELDATRQAYEPFIDELRRGDL